MAKPPPRQTDRRRVVVGRPRPAFARLPLRRQAALDAAALRLGLALGARALDDLLLLVDADDHVADDLVDHLQPAVELLHQLAAAVDHLEDVDAFLVVADLVGQLAAAPVLGLLDAARSAARRSPRPASCSSVDLLFGRVGREDVDELVLSVCHCVLLLDVDTRRSPRSHADGRRSHGICDRRWQGVNCQSLTSSDCRESSLRHSVVAGSPPLNRFITASIPSSTNISDGIGRPRDHRVDARRFVGLEPRQHVVGQIPPRSPRADADPQPRELVGRGAAIDRLQPVVPAGRSARAAPAAARAAAALRRRPPAGRPARSCRSAPARRPPGRSGS